MNVSQYIEKENKIRFVITISLIIVSFGVLLTQYFRVTNNIQNSLINKSESVIDDFEMNVNEELAIYVNNDTNKDSMGVYNLDPERDSKTNYTKMGLIDQSILLETYEEKQYSKLIDGEYVISTDLNQFTINIPITNKDNKLEAVVYFSYNIKDFLSEQYSHQNVIIIDDKSNIIYDNNNKLLSFQSIEDNENYQYLEKVSSSKGSYKIDRYFVSYQSIYDDQLIIAVISDYENSSFTTLLITVIIFALFMLSLVIYYHYKTRSLFNKIKSKQANFDIAIDSAHILILKIDMNGNILSFNNNFASLFGFTYISHEESLLDVIDYDHRKMFYRLIDAVQTGRRIKNLEMTFKNKGKNIHILWSAASNEELQNDIIELIGFDITERVALEKQLIQYNKDLNHSKSELLKQNLQLEKNQKELLENEKRIWDLAYLDKLTRLHNRDYFIEKCNEYLKNSDLKGALVQVDIDNFGHCNNIFGPNISDDIIIDVGTRIFKMTRKNCLIAKLASDEFGILLINMNHEEIVEYVEQLIEVNTYNFTHDGVTLHISVSAGVSFFPTQGKKYDDLIKTASLALKVSKENGKAQYTLYNKDMEKNLVNKMQLESIIRDGIDKNRYFLVYQPQYKMDNGEISGFEALLRLKDSNDDYISPYVFIPVLEETKLIIPIGYWVLQEACNFIYRLQQKGVKNLNISVNVSVIQFLQDDFVYNVKKILSDYKIDPNYLELEITETSLMHFDYHNLSKINDLRNYGINIALDDFGTGYSSLIYFKKTTNISVLKIDREFINDITLNDNNIEIVDAIIYLAHKFNFLVVAEGVETIEQYKILTNLGCDKMQGYLGSKPISEDVIHKSLIKLSNINNII